MKIYVIILIMLIAVSHNGVCQVSRLDTGVVLNWPVVGNGFISKNGLLVGYRLSKNAFVRNGNPPGKLIVKSLETNKKWQFDNVLGEASFTKDGKKIVFLTSDQRLHIEDLVSSNSIVLSELAFWERLTKGSNDCLLYSTKAGSGKYVLKNLITGKENRYDNVVSIFTGFPDRLLLCTGSKGVGFQLKYINLNNNIETIIWKGDEEAKGFMKSFDGAQLAFLVGKNVWYCNFDKSPIAHLISIPANNALPNYSLAGIVGLNEGNAQLLLRYDSLAHPASENTQSAVNIFSFQDRVFDLNINKTTKSYTALFDIQSQKLYNIKLGNGQRINRILGKLKLAIVRNDGGGEYYWNKNQAYSARVYRIDTPANNSIEIGCFAINVSPSERYLCWQKKVRGDIFLMDLVTKKIRNLSGSLQIPSHDGVSDEPAADSSKSLEPISWLDKGDILIYDRYDIWQIDASGGKKPVNLTNGYGRKHHIRLRFINKPSSDSKIKTQSQVYLTAYNEETKDNGFAKIRWQSGKDPEILSMGPYFYTSIQSSKDVSNDTRATEKWLVRRESTSESANYFWSSDLKTFHPVTDIHPEKNYQWFTTELINYTTKDGVHSQAVLFKQDNLDTTKRHPVLFQFYDKETVNKNIFRVPGYAEEMYFNMPLMLAKGYLVCVPDIYFKKGQTAHNIVDCVEGAADEIAKRGYVDSSRYGASGGSFGGYGINCLGAFSHKFKALVPVSGSADLISAYGNVPGLRDEEYENRQFRMGVSLSTDPELYLHNSPVAYAREVTTPILIVNGAQDVHVNPQQGTEWFISLRREGKPAWLLYYPDEEHGISKPENQKDFSLRMSQFFDHYLMDAPTPKWMMDSLPVWERSGEEGFKLMPKVVEPGPGLNTEEDIERTQEYLKSKEK